jgi:hypothetical protein
MPLLFTVLLVALASTSNHVVSAPSAENPGFLDAKKQCANATTEYARRGAILRNNPAKPRKLTELPPAETYAAVYRLENGCVVPVLYRDTRELRPPKR